VLLVVRLDPGWDVQVERARASDALVVVVRVLSVGICAVAISAVVTDVDGNEGAQDNGTVRVETEG